jgi:hypothetical protein
VIDNRNGRSSKRLCHCWLERRMYREICNAIKGVLGKDLDLQFVAAP